MLLHNNLLSLQVIILIIHVDKFYFITFKLNFILKDDQRLKMTTEIVSKNEIIVEFHYMYVIVVQCVIPIAPTSSGLCLLL